MVLISYSIWFIWYTYFIVCPLSHPSAWKSSIAMLIAEENSWKGSPFSPVDMKPILKTSQLQIRPISMQKRISAFKSLSILNFPISPERMVSRLRFTGGMSEQHHSENLWVSQIPDSLRAAFNFWAALLTSDPPIATLSFWARAVVMWHTARQWGIGGWSLRSLTVIFTDVTGGAPHHGKTTRTVYHVMIRFLIRR